MATSTKKARGSHRELTPPQDIPRVSERRSADWPELSDGRWYRLQWGRDFDLDQELDPGAAIEMKARAARTWGRRNGFSVHCSLRKDERCFDVQFVPKH